MKNKAKIQETLDRFQKTAQEALAEDAKEVASMPDVEAASDEEGVGEDVDPLFDPDPKSKFSKWAK